MKLCTSSAPVLYNWIGLTVSQTSLTFRFKTFTGNYYVDTGFLLQYTGELTTNVRNMQ